MRRFIFLLVLSLIALGVLFGLNTSFGPLPPAGQLLDPLGGLYATARGANHARTATVTLPQLGQPVEVVRDARGVPHIFAETIRDATIALGYVTAQDRLFQMDFLPRVAAGRLSEAFGEAALEIDREHRRLGMAWGAHATEERIRTENGIELQIAEAYVSGVNAYIQSLAPHELPTEFRLAGYRPEPFSILNMLFLLQYMSRTLSYDTDLPDFSSVQSVLGEELYDEIFPVTQDWYVPMLPGDQMLPASEVDRDGQERDHSSILKRRDPGERFQLNAEAPGRGSNGWVVSGSRSVTGSPILAGDVHLSLTLPSIWYEVHIVTPETNTYGVTIPGAPVLVQAFNQRLGWTFTNLDADQIDFYRLELDGTGRRYRFEDRWLDIDFQPDTIHIRGDSFVIDTLRFAHWGPIRNHLGRPIAEQWTAHKESRILRALIEMNRATTHEDFQAALEYWDTPALNILYADVDGNISARSAGNIPIRGDGRTAIGVHDGASGLYEWTGRIPIDELPYALNPDQGFLASANQQPVGTDYPHYLGHRWPSGLRSIRINELLTGKQLHSVDDFRRYQADVVTLQHEALRPVLDTLGGLSPRAEELRNILLSWDGETSVDRPEPLILFTLVPILADVAWNNVPGHVRPRMARTLYLLRERPNAPYWNDRNSFRTENAGDVVRMSLEATADSLEGRYGWNRRDWRWGNHHKVLFSHVTGSDGAATPFAMFGRGPFEYPGFGETISPGANPFVGRGPEGIVTGSASWRVIVDFSESPPVGYGVYPGGQSGHPMSPIYDTHIATYLNFEHFRLLNPGRPSDLPSGELSSRLTLAP